MNYRSEIRDTVWLALFQGLNYIVPIILWPYLMYVLGAEGWGNFTFGLSVAQWLILIVDFGFNLTATKRISLARGNQEEVNKIFTATLCAKLLLLAVSGLFLTGIVLVPRFAIYRRVTCVFFLMVAGSCCQFVWLYQGLGQIWRVSGINAVCKLLILPLVFVLVKSDADVVLAALLQSASFVACGVWVVISIRVHGYARLCRVAWDDIREALRDGLPVFMSSAATSVYTALFVVILAWFALPDEVGRYTAAEKLMRSGILLLWSPLVQAFFPRVSRLSKEDRESAERLIKRLTVVSVTIAIVIGTALFVGAEPIAALLGKDYTGIAPIARVLSVVPLFVCTGGITGQLGLLAMGDEDDKRRYRNVYLTAAAVALLLVLPAAKYWQGRGVAIAVAIVEMYVCAGVGRVYFKKSNRG